ncbi:glycoside hydrolase family 79 protein [Hypholoma sublateritium FD-334 SS-4]|uniref:Glycoside hydrolase family 79 protein n=1 Tax=Hypholoma sublateritium (strain FD-334 SS-4) TaxID=945553 RepID=A0A0D2LF82_HYPSF|nr:glycoside hydrolase family 79 protein [Hypholoma sublateritium FD-334 SS-4]
MHPLRRLTTRAAFLIVTCKVAACLDIALLTKAPSAAVAISPSFLSLSIEQDRWTDWVGTTSRNEFFFNTLDNLNQITGQPPHIRIGANSEDHTNFGNDVEFAEDIFPAVTATVPYPEATNITVGDGFYQAAQFLPPNSHVSWGLNLGENNLTAAFLEAKSLAKAFSSSQIKNAGITLDAIEIGNEADLYSNNGLRASTYTSTQYVSEWTTFANNVSATIIAEFPDISPKFWGAAFAGSSHSTTGFSPQAIFAEGVLTSPAGKLISTISEHHYSGSFCSGNGGLLQDLMTKSTIRSNLTQYSPDITSTHAKGLDYVLGETNSYSCHGAPGVSNTGGAALWTLDYSLFASQLGVLRVFFHDGIGFKYNLIQPITLTRSTLDGTPLTTPSPPHVQPQYYAAIIAAEAIGNSGNTKVIELSINDTRVSGYAFYEGDTLARAVLINSQAFFTTDTTPRTSVQLNLTFTDASPPKNVSVKRLFVPHADDTTGLTWGGQNYDTSDGRISGSLQVDSAAATAGIEIQETEVVMLSF